jgi:hypothetical protein
MRVHVESDAISSAGRAAHDISLGALIGGNLFARLAMHPALGLVSDPRERGRVANQAWKRYGVVNSLALSSLLAGWIPARFGEARPDLLSPRERPLAVGKDLAMCAVAVTGIASAVEGVGGAHLASALALAAVNATLSQATFRRPPKRRLLKRRY